jgi:rhamnose utilization protein RhaD (predicted bifunctional aldolase and dehydrogenase)
MENNFSESLKNSGYNMNTVEEKYQTPLKFNSLNDRSQTFQNSDLKEIYLTREQLNAKKVAISISR